MKIRQNRLKTYYHKSRNLLYDDEGGTSVIYDDYKTPFVAELWPGNDVLQAEMYGERLSNIRNLRLEGVYEIRVNKKNITQYVFPHTGLTLVEGDGLCLYVDHNCQPDYQIIAIKPYKHLRIEAEKL